MNVNHSYDNTKTNNNNKETIKYKTKILLLFWTSEFPLRVPFLIFLFKWGSVKAGLTYGLV